MSSNAPSTARPPFVMAALLIVGGLLGLLASFALTMDHDALLKDPAAALSCNISPFLQCGKNIESWQGQLFGFPNPILGLMMFPAPLAVGVALLAGAQLRAWFWWLFEAGLTFGLVFVFWLAFQSIYALNTLCPWCALVYLVMIPMWVMVTVFLLRSGYAGTALIRLGSALQTWTPLICLVLLVIIFGNAQLHLNVLGALFG